MSEQGTSWQENKDLPDRLRHMLDTSLLSDVTFLVGGDKEEIKCHRFMLVAASPVFEAMFCGGLKESCGAIIEVPDVEANIFRGMLSFIYTDTVCLNKDNAVHLLYAAKKYILPRLEEQCDNYLGDNVSSDIVCSILTQCISYSHQSLQEKCLQFIGENTKSVIENEDFLTLSPEGLRAILSLEEMDTDDEVELYQAAVKWAREQITGPDKGDSAVREIIGDALFLIRLPTSDVNNFSEVCGEEEVLTYQEKCEIFRFILTTGKRENPPQKVCSFPCVPRKLFIRRHMVFRFADTTPDPKQAAWTCSSSYDGICVQVSGPVELFGVGLYRTKSKVAISTVELCVYDSSRTRLGQTIQSSITCSDDYIVEIMLDTPVKIMPGAAYTICVKILSDASFKGVGGLSSVTTGGVAFTFSNKTWLPGNNNGTNINVGQIPCIIFHTIH